jgi:hypothetical protein
LAGSEPFLGAGAKAIGAGASAFGFARALGGVSQLLLKPPKRTKIGNRTAVKFCLGLHRDIV